MKKIAIILILLITVKFLFFYPANSNVNYKLYLIKNEISKRGYTNNWFIISGKRHSWYNKILLNSSKKSYHLKGDAIDIYVLDIDNDGIFDSKDIQIIESANKEVELNHPELIGALGTYTNKGYFSKHMIHIDTRGYKKRYNE